MFFSKAHSVRMDPGNVDLELRDYWKSVFYYWVRGAHLECDTQVNSILSHHLSHASNMAMCVQRGHLQEALASTLPQATCGHSCCAQLLEMLQAEMLARLLDNGYLCKPEHLARSDIKNVFSHLMASESLKSNYARIQDIFDNLVRRYYPNNVKIFFDTFTLYIHDDTHRQKFLKNFHSAMELCLYELLQRMKLSLSGYTKEDVRELRKKFSDLIQAMAIPLHDTFPAILYNHCPLFTRAVLTKLAPEALLLYDAGAVGNRELRLLAKDPDFKKMFKSEEDNSVLAVFLRKVLNKPRSLESLATMQVSRLLWCHAPEDKEKRAKDLGLLDSQVERVLLRHQCGRYREALKLADDKDKAGAS